MKLIPFFDLDDTLYKEEDFVVSGFNSVAKHLSENSDLSQEVVLAELKKTLANQGRGKVFNETVRSLGIKGVEVRLLVSIYRSHSPQIQLFPQAVSILGHLKEHLGQHVYVLTDGNRFVQRRKVDALGLDSWITRAFFTRDLSLKSEKPSLHYFEKLAKKWGVGLDRILYVGDDPNKDFVGLNRSGATTVRVLTGRFANEPASREFDAMHTIDDLGKLPEIISSLD